ncbi:MAG TPA: hypothetical protein VL049_00695 [Candidatus Dormibacteraeota bacterium]|nr:hypothetical protein [Candidatus Dormibacteraeota bacterium]
MPIRSRFIVASALIVCAIGCTRGSEQGGTPLEVKGLHVELPAGWKSVPPTSSMRVAQAIIEGPGGPAELAVFHFGAGQGGDIDANIQRWIAQIVPQQGTSPQREAFQGDDGLRITWVDAEGTLQGGPMGMGPTTPQPGSRLLGAVVEGDGGPWFFKATGPDATLAPQRLAFRGMLQRARLAK